MAEFNKGCVSGGEDSDGIKVKKKKSKEEEILKSAFLAEKRIQRKTTSLMVCSFHSLLQHRLIWLEEICH